MPAFMNQPQYQQQMQGLAMQVRQQEEGTKKIKKFLKAYEDIQLSAPMAPQQPGFMGGGMPQQPQQPQQPMMQPPGGGVRAGNNNIPRNDMSEPAPESFTAMAGGSVPYEGEDNMVSYSGADGGEEMSTPTSSDGGIKPRLDQSSYPSHYEDSPDDSEYVKGQKAKWRKEYDSTPLEKRGIPADAEGRQAHLKRQNQVQQSIDKGRAENMQRGSRNWVSEQVQNIRESLDRITRVLRKGTKTSIETDPRTGKTYPIAGYSKEEVDSAKEREPRTKAKLENAKKIEEHQTKKLNKIRDSKPNKALGLVGMAGASMAASKAGAASLFPPQDPDLFLGSISATKDWEKLRPDQKAMVQKFLEYKAESDSLAPSTRPPRGKGGYTDEPIELTSYDKLLRGQ